MSPSATVAAYHYVASWSNRDKADGPPGALRSRGVEPETALRDVLLGVDREQISDPVIYASVRLRKQYNLKPEDVVANESRRTPTSERLIAGIIESASKFVGARFHEASADPEQAIQLRAELLVDRALSDQSSWLAGLGESDPSDPEAWHRRAVAQAMRIKWMQLAGDWLDTSFFSSRYCVSNR